MRKILMILLLPISSLAFSATSFATSVSVYPDKIVQGDPVRIVLEGAAATTSIKSAYVGKTPINFFIWDGKPTALYGVDLSAKPGLRKIEINLNGGEIISGNFNVVEREKIVAPLGIPEKLGGNTPAAAQKLISNLVDEQATLSKFTNIIRPKTFWQNNFIFPVKNPLITDVYGYTRDTVGVQISHKGTDFRAAKGTSVLAINRGVVRLKGDYPTFGKMVVVDHGFGLYSAYLHLSKIKVNVGELVTAGETIALSGDTGYAESPHLHLTIRMNGVSIDPIKFYELFQISPPPSL